MRAVHLPITGDDLLAVERFRDDTSHMIEYLALTDCSMGRSGQYIRRFLSEDGYAGALKAQQERNIRIRRHFRVIEGHILPDKPKKKRRK